jgi:hypothetical protein
MKGILSLFLLLFCLTAFAQDEWKEASKESQQYHEYRLKLTTPPYGLAYVKDLIKKIAYDEESNGVLKGKTYESLSIREKFTYHMIHAESYSQNCGAMPPIQDEQKKIFANLPDAFNERSWSDRQSTFLKAHRDSVIGLMKESIDRTKRVGLNYKQAIIEVNALEMIPLLIITYNMTKKDHDILTIFLLLMKENEYGPFISSGSYKKLYGNESNYATYLNYNQANADLIIKRATDFYNANKR